MVYTQLDQHKHYADFIAISHLGLGGCDLYIKRKGHENFRHRNANGSGGIRKRSDWLACGLDHAGRERELQFGYNVSASRYVHAEGALRWGYHLRAERFDAG